MSNSIRIEENASCRYRETDGNGIRVIWELTGRCNLKCKHCFACVTTQSNISTTELTTDEAIAIVEQFKDINVSKVMLTGGEVFVRNDIPLLVRTIRKINEGIVIDITTNALLIDKNSVLLLKESGISELSISLDGTKDIYCAIRGKNADYSKLLENIRFIVEEGILVDGIMVLNRVTCRGLEDTIDLASSLGFSSFTIAKLERLPYSNFDYDSLSLSDDEQEVSMQKIEQLKKKYRGRLIIRTTGFVNCTGHSNCKNSKIISITREGMYRHCLNIYRNNEPVIDSRLISLKDALNIINASILEG